MQQNNRYQKEKQLLLLRELTIRKAREDFWTFLKIIEPDFYNDNRIFLKTLAYYLQALYEGALFNPETQKPYNTLIINMPPRHGKSRTLVNWSKWLLGQDITNKIMSCSYADSLATEFSRYTRDGISEEKNMPLQITYSDIFPDTKIKQGDASFHKWALEGYFFNYLGAGVGTGITGKGTNCAIIDDPVKDYEAAMSETALDKTWNWYTGTFLSRLEEGAIKVINMTRWSEKDLCGRLLKGKEPLKTREMQNGKMLYFDDCLNIIFEAYDKNNNSMLCDELLSHETYEDKKKNCDTDDLQAVFSANYHQETIDLKGRLYQKFLTYDKLPKNSKGQILEDRRLCYIDTADEGDDYLCAVSGVEYNTFGYITDIYYTKEPQEITENKTVEFLIKNDIKDVLVESNSGGKAFARNIRRILKEKGNNTCQIRWFHQSKNKQSRIMTNASNVETRLLLPTDWKNKFPEYYQVMASFQRNKTNKHDDGPDATTGFVEMIDRKQNNIKAGEAIFG